MTWVEPGVVTFLPPIWEIVNSIEALPAATLKGITVVYFFLTKDMAIRCIFLPPRAAAERGLRLNLRLRTVRLLINLLGININYNFILSTWGYSLLWEDLLLRTDQRNPPG